MLGLEANSNEFVFYFVFNTNLRFGYLKKLKFSRLDLRFFEKL
jgi:hypothetical protein